MKVWFEMGGYGAFIWSAYGLTLSVLLINLFLNRWRRKKLITRLKSFLASER